MKYCEFNTYPDLMSNILGILGTWALIKRDGTGREGGKGIDSTILFCLWEKGGAGIRGWRWLFVNWEISRKAFSTTMQPVWALIQ